MVLATSRVSFWILVTKETISAVASADWAARVRTSSAITAKPRPSSPARAASMEAFKASKWVWAAKRLIKPTTLEIFCEDSSRLCTFWAVLATVSWRTCILSTVWFITRSELSTVVRVSRTVTRACWALADTNSKEVIIDSTWERADWMSPICWSACPAKEWIDCSELSVVKLKDWATFLTSSTMRRRLATVAL